MSRLPEGDRERFENFNNLLYEPEDMQNRAGFGKGCRLGAALILEGIKAERADGE